MTAEEFAGTVPAGDFPDLPGQVPVKDRGMAPAAPEDRDDDLRRRTPVSRDHLRDDPGGDEGLVAEDDQEAGLGGQIRESQPGVKSGDQR